MESAPQAYGYRRLSESEARSRLAMGDDEGSTCLRVRCGVDNDRNDVRWPSFETKETRNHKGLSSFLF